MGTVSQNQCIGLAAALLGGYPIFKEAIQDIWERRMTMKLSMTIALLAALLIGEFFTALVIMLFVLVAEVLERLTVGRGRRAIRDILELLPQTATILRDGQPAEVDIARVGAGDLILVRLGDRIPVDGKVTHGDSFVDESSITGESMPAEKKAGASVYAGTINQSGALEIEVNAVGLNTTFGKIIEIVEEAERSKAPIQKTADRLPGYLVYFALSAAALTFLITHNVRSTISVVIVAGACGIAAGTPLAILGAIGRAAKAGSILKGGMYLERLGTVDTVFLDKAGTVTFGTPEVLESRPQPGCTEREVLDAAATAEWKSEHPFARAIVKRVVQNSLLVTPKFVETVRIAKKCRRIIMQNFYGTLIVDGVGVLMAAFGLLNPLLAAFIHVSSELAFITNSSRLLPNRS